VEREGKWVVTIGFQRRSEDIECNHDFDTHEAMANVLGSRLCATRMRTSHDIVERGVSISMVF